jgi:hypothetical protein
MWHIYAVFRCRIIYDFYYTYIMVRKSIVSYFSSENLQEIFYGNKCDRIIVSSPEKAGDSELRNEHIYFLNTENSGRGIKTVFNREV